MANAMQVHASNGVQRPAEGKDVDASIMERVIALGDLSKLTPQDRVAYYFATCRSVGLNPLTRPFEFLNLNGKTVMYATKNCTDQLRQIHGISVRRLERANIEGVHVVTASVAARDQREDEDVGAVSINGLKGEALANALMKATTKAKRRATLSICGLSFLDESEIDSIPGARRITVDADGVIHDEPKPGILKAAPPAEPQPDAAVFQRLCEQLHAAETPGAINAVAAAVKRAKDAGQLTEGHVAALRAAVKNAKERVAPPPPPELEYEYDSGPRPERQPGED